MGSGSVQTEAHKQPNLTGCYRNNDRVVQRNVLCVTSGGFSNNRISCHLLMFRLSKKPSDLNLDRLKIGLGLYCPTNLFANASLQAVRSMTKAKE